MKVHLVDGTYELFRSYYGAPPAQDAQGREVGATRGIIMTLAALLRTDGVTHVACAFDHVIESFRNDLFDGYKRGEGIEPALLSQFELAEEAAACLGLVVWPMVEFEADDAIATAAARFSALPEVGEVVLCSPDKDLAQCVKPGVVCLDRRRDRVLDEGGVREKFGVSPGSIPDWLALVGDTADGIPGIRGFGKKSASIVLARYGSIEAIPDREDDWDVTVRGAARLAKALRENREAALLYKKLATLRTDVPLKESLADLEWRGAPAARMARFTAEIGEPTLLDRVQRFQ